ncbi:hypothetical protein ACQKGL_16935 [Ensifer adhaerens]|uniref:hypothetical protein n=1 Tax=Ensifer adhaerens TaxID=106592 RepID=UPI003D00776A
MPFLQQLHISAPDVIDGNVSLDPQRQEGLKFRMVVDRKTKIAPLGNGAIGYVFAGRHLASIALGRAA